MEQQVNNTEGLASPKCPGTGFRKYYDVPPTISSIRRLWMGHLELLSNNFCKIYKGTTLTTYERAPYDGCKIQVGVQSH